MRVSSKMTIAGVYLQKAAREDKVMFYALLNGSGGSCSGPRSIRDTISRDRCCYYDGHVSN